MSKQVKKEDLMKELEDVKSLTTHLEDEYRNANVSEKYYQELKGKYVKRLKNWRKGWALQKRRIKNLKREKLKQ